MASSISNEDGIPRELKEKLATFDTHLSELEAGLSPLLATNRLDLSKQLDAIDEAKTDLVAAYAINSLFWMYLNVCGVNPKEHSVKQELVHCLLVICLCGRTIEFLYFLMKFSTDVTLKSGKVHLYGEETNKTTRIQSYMTRVKEIEDKKKAPKLNKAVTKRYIRSALWKAAQDKTEGGNGSEPGTAAPAAAQSSHTSHTQPSKMADKDGRKRKRDHR